MAKAESKNPGSFKGNMEGSGPSDVAKSMLPGSFISMEAGADPNGPEMHDNGPLPTESHTQIESGPSGLGMRSKTERCESPYVVK